MEAAAFRTARTGAFQSSIKIISGFSSHTEILPVCQVFALFLNISGLKTKFSTEISFRTLRRPLTINTFPLSIIFS